MNENTKNGRREFIGKVATYTGGAIILGGTGWIGSACNETEKKALKSNEKPVKIGLVGTGSRGNFLLELLLAIPSAKIVALCDNYAPNLKLGHDITKGKAKTYTNHKEMFEKEQLDAVVVATPLSEHAHIVIDAFSAGLHVFCEKAMARTVEQCVEMVKASEQAGKLFILGHQRMFDPNYLVAMELLKNKQIGKLTQIRAYWHRNGDWRRPVPSPELERKINWRLYNEYSCGLMTELASHHIHVANWVLNSSPISVMGSGSINYWKDGREVFDNVNLVYEYPGGIHFNYDSLISNKHYGMEIQVMGDKGTFEMESGLFYSENLPPSPGMLQMINNIERGIFDAVNLQGTSWAPELISPDKPSPINPDKNIGDGTKELLIAFADFVKIGKPMPELTKIAFNATVATLYGDIAMKEKRIITIPNEHRM